MQNDFGIATVGMPPTMIARGYGPERRDSQRLRTVYRIARVHADGKYGLARVHDISNEGLMLSTQLQVALGSVMAVDLSETCSLSGHVA